MHVEFHFVFDQFISNAVISQDSHYYVMHDQYWICIIFIFINLKKIVFIYFVVLLHMFSCPCWTIVQLVFLWAGHTVTSMGPGNGWDCSATSQMSWWVPNFQYRKPIIPLGQCMPSGYSATGPKYPRCSEAIPTCCSSCSYRSPVRLDVYPGICPYSLPRGAHKDLDETWGCWNPVKQLWSPFKYQFKRQAIIIIRKSWW